MEFYKNDTAIKLNTYRYIMQGFPWEEGVRGRGVRVVSRQKSDVFVFCADEEKRKTYIPAFDIELLVSVRTAVQSKQTKDIATSKTKSVHT